MEGALRRNKKYMERQNLRTARLLAGESLSGTGVPATMGPGRVVARQKICEPGEAKRRFEICKECEDSREDGSKCVHRKRCCFGSWRSRLNNHCITGKW